MDEYTSGYTNSYQHTHPPHHDSYHHIHTSGSEHYPPPPPPSEPPPPAEPHHSGILGGIIPHQFEEYLPLILMGLGALGIYLYIKKDGDSGILGGFLK